MTVRSGLKIAIKQDIIKIIILNILGSETQWGNKKYFNDNKNHIITKYYNDKKQRVTFPM